MKASDIPSNLPAASTAGLLSCDPGSKRCALAYWQRSATSGRLVHVGFTDTVKGFVFPGAELAIEIPYIYPKGPQGKKEGADPNDSIAVAYAAGLIAGLRQPRVIETYLPREWKKQIPKQIHHERIWNCLEGWEREVLPIETWERIQIGINGGPYSWGGHNLLDAVGIGLVFLGRLRP